MTVAQFSSRQGVARRWRGNPLAIFDDVLQDPVVVVMILSIPHLPTLQFDLATMFFREEKNWKWCWKKEAKFYSDIRTRYSTLVTSFPSVVSPRGKWICKTTGPTLKIVLISLAVSLLKQRDKGNMGGDLRTVIFMTFIIKAVLILTVTITAA